MKNDSDVVEVLTNRPFSKDHLKTKSKLEKVARWLKNTGALAELIAIEVKCIHDHPTNEGCDGTRSIILAEGGIEDFAKMLYGLSAQKEMLELMENVVIKRKNEKR